MPVSQESSEGTLVVERAEVGGTNSLTVGMLMHLIPGLMPEAKEGPEERRGGQRHGRGDGTPRTVLEAARAVLQALDDPRDAPKSLNVGVRYFVLWFDRTYCRDAPFPVTEDEVLDFLKAHQLVPNGLGFAMALDQRVDVALTLEKLKRKGPTTTERLEDVIDAIDVLHEVCEPTQNPISKMLVGEQMARMGVRRRRRAG